MTGSEPFSEAGGLVRVYPAAAHAPGQALVWSHGGAFRGGDLDMPEADWVARALAARGVTVVSVDYRRASEAVSFPAPSDDVLTAYLWTRAHAAELAVDAARIVIGGASAGGNLTAGVALRLNRGEGPLPAGVFLAYPTLHALQPPTPADLQAALDRLPEDARFDTARIISIYESYLGGPIADATDVAIPGLAASEALAGLPPVLIINDDVDGLRVSGEAFAATLASAGVPVTLFTEPGTHHGHLNRPEEPQAAASIDRVLSWLAALPVPSNPHIDARVDTFDPLARVDSRTDVSTDSTDPALITEGSRS